MSKYSTGELAKLCGVTVRTVQYYDTRGILIPSELSEGGRRLYSEDDLKRMKLICFLRELDLPIDAISQLLKEEHPENVISLLIEQQESALSEEIAEKREKLEKLRWTTILTGIPVTALQWASILLWIFKKIWWPFALWVLVAVPWGVLISRYYFNHVKYICPECHEVFKPAWKEAFWANHNPTARKLTCTACGRKGFCVEIWGGDEK